MNLVGCFGSVKWSILVHLKSQPCGQNFQAQKLAHLKPEPTKIPKTHLK